MARRLTAALRLGLPALALALLLAEGAVRWLQLGPEAPRRLGDEPWTWGDLVHRRSAVPGLVYELVPSLDTTFEGLPIRTNALGLRGPELREPGLRRIAVLGDSTTFGWGVPGELAWPARLQDELDALAGAPQYEVLNFGVSGYSSRDEALVLRARALPLHPSQVLVGYNLNDPDDEPNQPLRRFFAEPRWWEPLRLLRWVDAAWRRREKQRLGGGDLIRMLHAPGSDSWGSVTAALQDMADAARAAQTPVLLVIFPLGRVPADPAAYRYADLHAQVEAAARQAGLDVLDLVPAFAAAAGGPEYLLPDLHPNPLGHAIAAHAVAARLLIDPPGVPRGG